MTHRLMLHAFSIGLIILLPGCASIISGNESTTYIETDPEKARCELDGKDFKRVVHTPDTIRLSAKAAPIKITCTADGYHPATAEMATTSDGSILGNIIFGGVIGVAVDAASQSGMKFPERISLALDPKGFKTAADREAWYKRRRAFIEQQWTEKFLASSQSVDCDTSSEATKRTCFDKNASAEFRSGRADALAKLKDKFDVAGIGARYRAKPARRMAAAEAPKKSGPSAGAVAAFEKNRANIAQAITDYYDISGYSVDFPDGTNGAQLNEMKSMSLHAAVGERIEVEARYIAVSLWDNGSHDRASRFTLKQVANAYQVLESRALRHND